MTLPISTSRKRILVLPATRLSPVSNLIWIVGPVSVTFLYTSQRATRAATIGTSQTTENRFLALTAASGNSPAGRAGIGLLIGHLLPPRHPRSAGGRIVARRAWSTPRRRRNTGRRPGTHGSKETQLDQRDEDRHHKHVQHGPTADQLHDAVDARPVYRPPHRTALG